MKSVSAVLLLIGLFFSGRLLRAQDSERVTVPLTDPSKPVRLRLHVLVGGMTIRGSATAKEVVVETHTRTGAPRRERPVPAKAAGMHRIDNLGSGLEITEQDNVVNVKISPWLHDGELLITVPVHSSLDLKTTSGGSIDVEQVDGEVDADALNGKIMLKDVEGSVVAHALNGEIFATMDRINPSKPMSFSTLNGDIDVTLPASARANVRMKTDNGAIYSDFDIKLGSGTAAAATNDSGRHDYGINHMRMDKTMRGTINGGGPEYQFTSFNGQIFIRKKK